MRFDIRKTKDGQFYFNQVARNHEIVSTSETYTRKENAIHTANQIEGEEYSGIIDYTIDEEGVMIPFKSREHVRVPKKEYEELVKKGIKLEALEQLGVDNWGNYGEWHEMFEEIAGMPYDDFDIEGS